MKALVLEEYNNFKYRDFPEPEIGSKDVLIRVRACGICGSDVHGMDGSSGRRIPPIIMGHEASGEIASVGSEVTEWKVGDRVTFDSTVYPVDDWYTKQGHYNLSDNRQVVGVSPGEYRRHGAFAEFVAVPCHVLHRIPDTVSFEQAAMVEPIAVASHSVKLGQVSTTDYCVVIGVGTIGLFVLQLLKIAGVQKVFAIDLSESNRKRALAFGADLVFAPGESELESKLLEATEGRGADISFEAVGIEATLNLAIDLLRKGGTSVLVGNLAQEVKFPLQKVVTREIRVQGSCGICGDYPEVLQLLEDKKIEIDSFLAAIAPLSEGAEWFDKLQRNEVSGKVILRP